MTNFQKKLERRKQLYKEKESPEKNRQSRYNNLITISKKKRECLLNKKRQIRNLSEKDEESLIIIEDSLSNIEKLPLYCKELMNTNTEIQLQSLQQIRNLLIIPNNPFLDQIIESDILPQLIEFLKDFQKPKLQFEATWCLTNIACGTPKQTQVILEEGAIPVLLELFESPYDAIIKQTLWTLGNLANDGVTNRDLLLSLDIVKYLYNTIQNSRKKGLINAATWLIYNLCRGVPYPNFILLQPLIPILLQLLQVKYLTIVENVCWSFSYLCNGDESFIGVIVDLGLCPLLIDLLNTNSVNLFIPILRCLGNISSLNDDFTQIIIECQVLPILKEIILTSKKNIRKEACWVLSNICAGSSLQVEKVIQNGFLPILKKLLQNDKYKIKKQVCWTLTNMVYSSTRDQIENLIENGIVTSMCNVLEMDDPKILKVGLESVMKILLVYEQQSLINNNNNNNTSNISIEFIEKGGLVLIEKLRSHDLKDVYKLAEYIMKRFFLPFDEESFLLTNLVEK
ncbi:importin subunit alpha-4 [Anaeramoeba flamelloides]|uniref:Importin subunit alpha n=1 Tax=Anaeramoeba flamelloides TaxID=1746091 RepID=A0ABQ8XBR2_9EUKA|nr:importin subunit alpha-4 [Anaeramoeba flamelloides]